MSSMMIYLPIVMALIGLAFMAAKRAWVLKQDPGDGKMKEISDYIYEGALAFLKAEYKLLTFFVIGASIALAGVSVIVPTTHILIVVAFVFGAIFSALAGNMGMKIATKTNVRTTQAARTSLPQALKVSFGGGTVMGLGVAGLAVLGLTGFFILLFQFFMNGVWTSTEDMTIVLETLAGFSLGAESIALFARVGGGIYTKAADVGADLVGKVEAGIPEDDPRNPATIADNVGDNVGDVAGMGADLFGSYVATVLAAMVLGNYVIKDMGGDIVSEGFGGIGPILLPMTIAGFGILFSIIGTMLVKIKDNSAKEKEVQGALNIGNWVSIALTAIACFVLVKYMLPETMRMDFFGEGIKEISSMRVFYATIVGLFVGGVISSVTEYYTGLGTKPVLAIVQKSSTGAGTNVIAGLATGMISTFPTVLIFAGAIWASYALAGFYGVALAASAMMATTAMQLAIDAFGPISDNAGGIAEMSELPKEVRTRTDILDSVGNTTAATGKGFAIASAALTSLALFAAYVTFTGIDGINIFKAPVLAMLFVGGMIPVVFSALAMNSVGKAAMDMVYEVRRQFKEIPGIMEGTGKPEYGKCVEISTKAALREMMLPGILTIGFPILIATLPMLLGYENKLIAEMLGGYMAGVTVSGVLWAVFQNNAGGAWDNAKKSFEAGVMINGEMTYKGSDAHKAAVTGDTVGDPFKDTSGPSMNILIKLTCLIGLVIAPMLGDHGSSAAEGETPVTEINTDRKFNYDPQTAALIPGDFNLEEATMHNIESGIVYWDATKVTGAHNGQVKVMDGKIAIINDTIVGGILRIAMSSINVSDIQDAESNQKLTQHLISPDFFDAKAQPYAIFKIDKSRGTLAGGKVRFEGVMNIKGISVPQAITMQVHDKDDRWVLIGQMELDRSNYNIRYGSDSFFSGLGDKAIHDKFKLKPEIVIVK
jgi:K(+)-stimulated pyrophosphate-energized sodium pump